MRVGAWQINYPSGGVEWALIGSVVNILKGSVSLYQPINALDSKAGDAAHPSSQRDDNKRRRNCTLALRSLWIKFHGHTELPSFPLSPIPPSLFTTLCLKDADLKKCRSVSAGRWSVHAPPTSSECLSQELYTISPEPPGDDCSWEMNAPRGVSRRLVCAGVCVVCCREKEMRGRL